MGIKLFVDDLRECPKGWVPARTVTEAIRILATRDVDEISLDHDIQCQHEDQIVEDTGDETNPPTIFYKQREYTSPETFEPVARYLAVKKYAEGIRDTKITFHTSNPIGGKNMAEILGIDYVPRKYPSEF